MADLDSALFGILKALQQADGRDLVTTCFAGALGVWCLLPWENRTRCVDDLKLSFIFLNHPFDNHMSIMPWPVTRATIEAALLN